VTFVEQGNIFTPEIEFKIADSTTILKKIELNRDMPKAFL